MKSAESRVGTNMIVSWIHIRITKSRLYRIYLPCSITVEGNADKRNANDDDVEPVPDILKVLHLVFLYLHDNIKLVAASWTALPFRYSSSETSCTTQSETTGSSAQINSNKLQHWSLLTNLNAVVKWKKTCYVKYKFWAWYFRRLLKTKAMSLW